jgi:hypothetical protein
VLIYFFILNKYINLCNFLHVLSGSTPASFNSVLSFVTLIALVRMMHARRWIFSIFGIRVPVHILNNVSIKQVLCYKHLGLIFNDKMTWSDHIDDICKRSNKCLDIILKIRYLLPRLCIEKLHKSFVCSMLDYSDVIDDNCSNVDSTSLVWVIFS